MMYDLFHNRILNEITIAKLTLAVVDYFDDAFVWKTSQNQLFTGINQRILNHALN